MKILLTLLTLYTFNSFAQVTQQWAAIYNGPGNTDDGGRFLALDGSGNVYVTGRSGSATYDYATLKYNSSGVQQWVAIYNGPANNGDEPYSLAVDGSGNVYVTGYTGGNGIASNYATLKYNSSGVQQWAARYNGPGNSYDYGYSLAVDGSGNVYVSGLSVGTGTDYDYATVKYNSSGDSLWVRRYNGPGNDEDWATSIAVDGSGNVYVTGQSRSGSTYGTEDYATIKYNSSGDSLWVRRYNGPGNDGDMAYSLAVDGSGNVYVTGGSWGSGTIVDYATIKYNSLGVQQWVARYNGPGNNSDRAVSLAVDGSGNVYVTGRSFGSGTYPFDYATLKYNSLGVQLWVARYDGPTHEDDYAYSLAVDGSGNVYVTGVSIGIGTGSDYATIKYNSSGVQQWVERYSGPGNWPDVAYSLAVDGSGNVYVTGQSRGSETYYDYATIKYSQMVGIMHISNEIPGQYSLSQNYPNPFNPATKIRFDIPSVGQRHAFDVQLVIYDMLGSEVATLVNEQLNAGTYEVDWDGSGYSSGAYYYKLTVRQNAGSLTGDGSASLNTGFVETKKMLLIK